MHWPLPKADQSLQRRLINGWILFVATVSFGRYLSFANGTFWPLSALHEGPHWIESGPSRTSAFGRFH
ncbi:hypothetical protein EMIT0P4_200084 [Pseudomonas sp. IT-P4]